MSLLHRCRSVAIILLSLGFWASQAEAQDADTTASVRDTSRVRAQVARLPDGRLQIGPMTIDADHGSLELPGRINMSQGVIEVLACSAWGKTHESLFVVDPEPYIIQTGLLLLWGLEPGSVGTTWEKLSQGGEFVPSGPEIKIRVRWNDAQGKEHMEPVERWVCGPKGHSAPKTKWVFNGSVMAKDGFVAQTAGNIVVTYRDPAAIVNNSTSSSANDELYYVCSGKVPAVGTPVTLVFSRKGKVGR